MGRIKATWSVFKEAARVLHIDLSFPFFSGYTLLVFGYLMSIYGRVLPILNEAWELTNPFVQTGLSVGLILILLLITSVVQYPTYKTYFSKFGDKDEEDTDNA